MRLHRHSQRLRLFSILFLCLTVSILRGQTIFTGPANGDWFTAANWSAGLPAAGNNATILGGASVTINAPLTVNFAIENYGNITNSSIVIIANALTSSGAFANSGTMTIHAGVSFRVSGGFNNSGTVINKGIFNCNSVPFINTATGIVNNESDWQQFQAFINDGTFSNKAGVFTCPQVFTNNKTVENLSGATFKIDFGGSFTNSTGSSLTNGGNFQNLATFINNTTVTNTGVFTNNGIDDCNGVFNNENTGFFETTGTVNLAGTLNNKVGAKTQVANNFIILANGLVSNAGILQNNGALDVRLNGTLNSEAGSTINMGFGSTMTNAGSVGIKASALVISNGSIINNKNFDVAGTIDSRDGGQISNSDAFTLLRSSLVKSINLFNNNGVLTIDGSVENNSGGKLTNTATIIVTQLGKLSNNADVFNKMGGSFTNNGTVFNLVRMTNEGSFVNNAYLKLTGDMFIRATGSFNNTEVVEIAEGSIVNEGKLTNGKTIINASCSVISNKAAINNTGRIENSGIVFQRGTVTGNAIVALSGFIQTAPTSAAQSICRTSLSTGTDPIGEAKVYGQNPLLPTWGIDECAGFQYSVDNKTRAVFTCAQVGQTINAPFRLLTRTGDSLTCIIPITVFDGVPPVFNSCPANATVFTTNATQTYTWATPTATDNCTGAVIITSNIASGAAFTAGTTTEVVITARDSKSNSADCRFKVTVVKVISTATCPTPDVTAPVFSNCPTNITVNTTGSGAIVVWNTPSVSDACYPIVLKVSKPSGSFFTAGTTTPTSVVYTATDANNNTSTCTFTVTFTGGTGDICATDNVKPVIKNCPSNVFVLTNPSINGAVAVWKSPAATDNCGAVTLTSNYTSGSIFSIGTTNVMYTATDAKNNSTTCNFTVTVGATNPCAGDVTPPTFSNCPTTINVTTTAYSAVATWTAPTATDACGGVVLNSSHSSGNTFLLDTTVVTYTASDKIGNRSTCSFAVVVKNLCLTDTVKPVLSACPANISLQTAGNSATATWAAPTATDNCSTATITINYQSGAIFPLGTTTVNYSATDVNGNAAICSFTVTIGAATPVGFDPNKCYKIVNKATGKVLDVEAASTADFARIFQWTLHNGPNQQWQLTKLVNGFYEIKNRNSDKLLDIVGSGGNCANGVRTEQYLNDNTGSQQWSLVKQADGSFKILNKTCNKTLRIANGGTLDGAAVELYDDSGAEYFKWLIVEMPCGAPAICINNGDILVERWNNNTDWRFPLVVPTTPPSVTVTQGTTQGPSNIGDNYFTRVRGYIRPQTTGNYNFNVTGDDNVELFLSTNSSPSSMQRIAYINGWTSETEYAKYPSQVSTTKALQANQLYYFELRHKEGGGGDGWRISWRTTSNLPWQPIPTQFLARPCSNTFQGLTRQDVFAFDAIADFNQAKLQWISNGGHKNDYFKVEHLDQTGNFETLETANAHTSNDVLYMYNYTDAHPLEGENHYRITTIPLEGTPQYSEVKKLIFSKTTDITIFPNPADAYIDIDLRLYESKTVTIYLYNALGKMVKKLFVEKVSAAPQRLNTQDLNTGSYLIRVQIEGKQDVLKQVKIAK